MISKVYQKSQIVIPAMLRDKYGLNVGTAVEVIAEEGYLKIRKVEAPGLMNLAGIVESEKPFPDKETIQATVQKSIIKRTGK